MLCHPVKLDPHNIAARYYLGLTLMRLNDNDLAAQEFRFIIYTSPDSHQAQLSRKALSLLERAKHTIPVASLSADNNLNQQSIKQAVSDIQLQTNRSKETVSKEEAKAAAVLKETDERASALEAEARQRQVEMSKAVYYGLESGYGSDGLYRSWTKEYPLYTANEIAAACEGLLLKAAQLRDQGAKEALDIRGQAKMKALAIEKSALLVERQLVDPKSPSSIKMQSKGTNLYVRNYETSSQDSGTGRSGQVSLLGQAQMLQPVKDKDMKVNRGERQNVFQ